MPLVGETGRRATMLPAASEGRRTKPTFTLPMTLVPYHRRATSAEPTRCPRG